MGFWDTFTSPFRAVGDALSWTANQVGSAFTETLQSTSRVVQDTSAGDFKALGQDLKTNPIVQGVLLSSGLGAVGGALAATGLAAGTHESRRLAEQSAREQADTTRAYNLKTENLRQSGMTRKALRGDLSRMGATDVRSTDTKGHSGVRMGKSLLDTDSMKKGMGMLGRL